MFSPWRTELRVGLCPDRIVMGAQEFASSEPIEDLRKLVDKRRAAVVLSNHFVRYAVLPWSEGLRSEEQWDALAKHTFDSIYGAKAAGWRILVSPAPSRAPRVASAVDASLLDRLYALAGVISIRPYLMSAFNARRRLMRAQDAWFVVQEPGRMTVCLVRQRAWNLVRHVRIEPDWRDALADVLEREGARSGQADVERVIAYSAERLPARVGRFTVEDATNNGSPRPAMTLH